jgi:hypothetical protein
MVARTPRTTLCGAEELFFFDGLDMRRERETTNSSVSQDPMRHERVKNAPAGFAPPPPLEAVPAACFSLSTAVFHARTISLASSETSFAACERSLPTARPALLSCEDDNDDG